MKKFHALGPKIPLLRGPYGAFEGPLGGVFFLKNSITINNKPIFIILISLESVKEGL